MTAVTESVEGSLEETRPVLEGPGAKPVPENRYTPEFGVIIICGDEKEQEQAYINLRALGYDDSQIRVATI